MFWDGFGDMVGVESALLQYRFGIQCIDGFSAIGVESVLTFELFSGGANVPLGNNITSHSLWRGGWFNVAAKHLTFGPLCSPYDQPRHSTNLGQSSNGIEKDFL